MARDTVDEPSQMDPHVQIKPFTDLQPVLKQKTDNLNNSFSYVRFYSRLNIWAVSLKYTGLCTIAQRIMMLLENAWQPKHHITF